MRLILLGSEEIKSLIDQMEHECHDIKAGAMKMAWYMRGGVSYEDILNMSISERQSISKIIEDNLETTKNSKMPFF
jgi:hypothetical protein